MDDEEPLAKFLKDRSEKLGQSPGSLVHVGERKEDEVSITVIDYGPDHAEEHAVDTVEEAFEAVDGDSTTWINVDGLHDEEVIGAIGDRLDLHPLIQEDVLNTDQRPKLEDLDEYLFLVLKMLSYRDGVDAEQVSILFDQDLVVTFQEQAGDVFDPVRDRIRNGKGQLRKKDADYLAYALLDAVVDNYFLVLEELSDRLESIEDDLVEEPERDTLQQVQAMKRELVFVRKSVWPLRETISRLERTESDIIEESTRIYLRDVYEHTVRVIDIVESFRDVLSGTLDVYMSSISNRMNEVMKVLTVIATIFIPLTFITGLYGMNFNTAVSPFNMPELGWYWGYPAILGAMAVIALGMVYYFHRRGWL